MTPSTRYLYKKALQYFLSYLELGPDDYVKLLDMDTKLAQMNICDYISYLRSQKNLASQTVIIVGAGAYYLASPLFISAEVNEPIPTSAVQSESF
jgi:hypothetical protein